MMRSVPRTPIVAVGVTNGRAPAGGGDPSKGGRGLGNPVGDPALRDDAGRGGGGEGGGGSGGGGSGGGGGGRGG